MGALPRLMPRCHGGGEENFKKEKKKNSKKKSAPSAAAMKGTSPTNITHTHTSCSSARIMSRSLSVLVLLCVLLTRAYCAPDGAPGAAGSKCSSSSECAAGYRCECRTEQQTPPLTTTVVSSPPPNDDSFIVDDPSPACRGYRTPLGQLLDASGVIVTTAWRGAGAVFTSSLFLASTANAAAAPTTTANESLVVCTCVAVQPPQPPQPLQPPPPLPPPLAEARTAISLSGRKGCLVDTYETSARL